MKTFQEKLELGEYLKEFLQPDDQTAIIELIWENLLENDLSFAVTDCDNDIVGICLNMDGQDQPDLSTFSTGLGIIIELVHSIESPIL